MLYKPLIFKLIVFLLPVTCAAQPLDVRLYDAYPTYREPGLETMRFKHADILPKIEGLSAPFEVSLAGRSVEGREIMMVRFGEGPERVLLWSQMHGDEPTATMALMDVFNFFQASDDGFDGLREEILGSLSLYVLPMLNPDGAERFTRRNAYGIDLNRDALRLQSPEARVLKNARDELEPGWGFNLHDQSRYYAAGKTGKQAGISFLAPAFNEAKDINPVRERAIRLIGVLNETLQRFIPGQVARYNDDFEPRAFGDNIQKWGTSTILIESGGLPDDPEKQELRRLHFVTLLQAMRSIATNSYVEMPMAAYDSIPMNDYGAYHDLILREVRIPTPTGSYVADLAFRRSPVLFNDHQDYYYRASITDLGDLSTQNAYEMVEPNGYTVELGKVYGEPLQRVEQLHNLNLAHLLKNGYTEVLIDQMPQEASYHQLPVRLMRSYDPSTRRIRQGGNPSLLLAKDGAYHYAVINGTLFDLRQSEEALRRQWEALLR